MICQHHSESTWTKEVLHDVEHDGDEEVLHFKRALESRIGHDPIRY